MLAITKSLYSADFFFFSPELPILVCFSLYQLINLSESILGGKILPRTEVVF